MNCPRCQNELADSATFCPACGSAIRPYTPQKLSYLPPGTPTWPTNVPRGAAAVYTTLDSVSPTVVMPRPQLASQQTARRTGRNWLLIAAVIILVPILGAAFTFGSLLLSGHRGTTQPLSQQASSSTTNGSSSSQRPATSGTGTAATGNQLPTPQKFQDLTSISALIGVTMKYPSNWVASQPQQTQYGNSVILSPQQQQFGIEFAIGRYTAQVTSSVASADVMNQQILQALSTSAGVNNFQLTSSAPSQRTISGTAWEEQDAAFNDDNNTKIDVLSISVEHNKLYYNIETIIPDMYYNEAMQKYIQPMLDSVKFVS